MPYQRVTITEFGGLDEDENPNSLEGNELSIAENVARLGKLTGTRPGVIYDPDDYASAISGTPTIQGGYEWRRNTDQDRDLLIVADGVIYKNRTTATDKTAVQVTDNDNAIHTFADHLDNVYMAAGGATDDTFHYWDGTGSPGAWTQIDVLDAAGSSIYPSYVFEKWNFLFLAGFRGDPPPTTPDSHPMVVRYPDYGTDYTDAANWHPGNSLGGFGPGGFDGPGGNYLTGFSSFQDNRGDWLLCLSKKRIFAVQLTGADYFTPFSVTDAIEPGCVNQRAFVDIGLDSANAIYMSDQGIHSLRMSQEFGGRSPKSFLSYPIRDTFANLNPARLRYSIGAYWRTEGKVLFLVSTGSNTTPDLILAMDILDLEEITPDTVRWYRWQLTTPTTVNFLMTAYDDDGVPRIYGGGNGGEVFYWDRTTYSDLGSAYTAKFRTKHDHHDLPGKEKGIGDLYLKAGPQGNHKPRHQFIFDYANRMGQSTSIELPPTTDLWDTGVWDEAIWGGETASRQVKIFGQGRGETVAHEFSHAGINEPFFIAELTQELAVLGEGQSAGDTE